MVTRVRAQLLGALLLGGCAVEEPRKQDYSCNLLYACGETGEYTTQEFSETPEDMQEIASGWADACTALMSWQVAAGECSLVLCGVICWPEEQQ